jgi:predicted GIY-YIG superfamily endonuclease
MNSLNTNNKYTQQWYVYIIQSESNSKNTYIGCSNDPFKRLKAHNGIICGGAKYTKMYRPWKHICIITGNNLNKIFALQLEWRLKKHIINNKLKRCTGFINRIKNVYNVLNSDQWTKNSIDSNKLKLHIKWFIDNTFKNKYMLSLNNSLLTEEFIY